MTLRYAKLALPIIRSAYQAAMDKACAWLLRICEQCDFFVPAPAAAPIIGTQLADIRALRADAQARGWEDEAARHRRVENCLQQHLDRLRRQPDTDPPT